MIRGVAGELYPCRDDIFAATYEPYEPPEEGPSNATPALLDEYGQ